MRGCEGGACCCGGAGACWGVAGGCCIGVGDADGAGGPPAAAAGSGGKGTVTPLTPSNMGGRITTPGGVARVAPCPRCPFCVH